VKVLVLDTSAFIMGFNPMSVEEPTYSTDAVEMELQQDTLAMTRLTTAKDAGKLVVQRPSAGSLEEVDRASLQAGDRLTLSKADRTVVALAVDLRQKEHEPVIVSDDYAVQNTAERFGVSFRSLATFGISHKFDWIYYCPGCHRRYTQARSEDCEVCGTRLRRKVLHKSPVSSKL
jgi:UPF0271 protein